MFDVDTEDFEWARIQGVPLRARLYKPRGRGPFPAMVDAHGGAWITGRYDGNDPINRPLAQSGVAVLAVDYRLPPRDTYPASVADINYAVRWLKANAERCGTRADLVGTMGTSSGGHLAVLAALKPAEPRYASVPLEGKAFDARVSCVVTLWPVICPLTRFRVNKERAARGENHHAARVGSSPEQMKYWLTEAAMDEGSPMLALERGDKVETPDILYVQAICDRLHPRECMDRFCAAYRKAGGHVEAVLVEGEPYDAVRTNPQSPHSRAAVKRMSDFILERSHVHSH